MTGSGKLLSGAVVLAFTLAFFAPQVCSAFPDLSCSSSVEMGTAIGTVIIILLQVFIAVAIGYTIVTSSKNYPDLRAR
ncbi:MAG: hypothetical protein HY365_02585 [Candidatus Aenigmarchaeota archaeon]|nr:hypothetical protein [Candidatus Aenigmarchaeota archaeon]